MGRVKFAEPKRQEWNDVKTAAKEGYIIIVDSLYKGRGIVDSFFTTPEDFVFGVRCSNGNLISSEYRQLVAFKDVRAALRFLYEQKAA